MCSQTRKGCAKAFDNRARSKNLKPKKSRGGGVNLTPPPSRLLGLTAFSRFVTCFVCSLLVSNNNNNSYNNNNNNNNNNTDNNNIGITQAAFPQSGSSSTWGTNGFTSLSKPQVSSPNLIL